MQDKKRQRHITGLLRLIDPDEVRRAKRQLGPEGDREKWLERLAHQVTMHPEFSSEPPKGSRDEESLLKALRELGAPEMCYVTAADGAFDDTFQPLAEMLAKMYDYHSHGTIFSCIPGRLALFRTAYPQKHLIVHRHD